MADTEGTLRANSDLLAKLAKQVPGVIYQFRMFPDGRSCFPFATEAMWDIYEVTPEEVREDASVAFTRIHPEDLAEGVRSIQESARTLEPWQWDYRVVLPVQGLRWRSGTARPERLADGSTLWHGFITDITERQEAQVALAESEERYRVLIEHAPEAIVVYDADTNRYTDANQHALDLFGMTRAELFAVSPVDVSPAVQADGRPTAAAVAPYIAAALAGAAQVFEWDHLAHDRRIIPCEVRLVRLPSATRRLLRGSISDITGRKLAEADLRLKDAAIATSLNAIAIGDAAGTVLYVNPAFVRLWGYNDVMEVVGRPMADFGSPDTMARVYADLVEKGMWQGETSPTKKDGTRFHVFGSANAVRDATGHVQHLMASFVDMTESKKLHAQLLQSQKMQTVGRLAGGVAHDFNNLLTVMKGYLELAQLQLDPDAPLAQDLAEVDRAVDSASSLTQQLLAFSRMQLIHPQVLDLNESVTRMRAMLSRLLGEDIELRQSTVPGLGLVRFDPTQVEQILMNLAVNARDAMPDGGTLTLETANVFLDEHYAKEHPETEPGEYVMLAVSDTGVGMSPEVRSHLFEPFFTTKALGRGTGLGLPMVFGAVTQSQGRIEVYSEPGHGTTFKVYLPRVNPDATARISPPLGTLPHGTETIVVVEDEDAIRALAVRVLTGLGYTVLAFRTGTAALDALASATTHVDLLLTAVIMPEMKGRELADRLRATRPDLPVIFASGYTDDVIASQGVLESNVDFLPKPYSTAILARRVRAALDRPAPAPA